MDVRYQLAETKYQTGKYAAALDNYSLLIERWPNSDFVPNALFGQAWSQFKIGDVSASMESLTVLIENHAKHKLIPRAV